MGVWVDTPKVKESVQTSSSSVREFLSSAQSPEQHWTCMQLFSCWWDTMRVKSQLWVHTVVVFSIFSTCSFDLFRNSPWSHRWTKANMWSCMSFAQSVHTVYDYQHVCIIIFVRLHISVTSCVTLAQSFMFTTWTIYLSAKAMFFFCSFTFIPSTNVGCSLDPLFIIKVSAVVCIWPEVFFLKAGGNNGEEKCTFGYYWGYPDSWSLVARAAVALKSPDVRG